MALPCYLAVSEREYAYCQNRWPHNFVRMDCRLSPAGELMELSCRCGGRQDLLGLCTRCPTPSPHLAAQLWEACRSGGYAGILMDLEGPCTRPWRQCLEELAQRCRQSSLSLYVPEHWGHIPDTGVLLCTAISGGTITLRLREGQQQYGTRLALDVQRLCMDFTLPARGGTGLALSPQQLSRLRQGRCSYFSAELGAKYFTYEQEDALHLVLFDDNDTIQHKCQLARQCGCETAFFMYPEWSCVNGFI